VSEPESRTAPLKRTPLYDSHRAAGARLVEFAGFEMPVQYEGVVAEHTAVRTAAGLFDVSHMGEALFDGPRALDAVQRLVTNDCAKLAVGQSLYSPICYPDGGIVDDCLVYRFGDTRYVVVINASNIDKDLAWMREHAGVAVEDLSDATCLLALQGPRAAAILARAAARDDVAAVPRNSYVELSVAGRPCKAARTGYTGEDGFEVFTDAPDGAAVWAALLEAGAADGLKPAGLGARDTLRLEARLCLYGNDIDQTTNPLEAGLGWTVKLDKPDFIGRDALRAVKAHGPARKLVGFEVTANAIARHGHAVYESEGAAAESPCGVVTSGTKAPTVGKPIGLAYVPAALSAVGQALWIDVRGKRVPAVVVKTPFYKRPEK